MYTTTNTLLNKIQGGQCLSLNYYNILKDFFPATKPNDILKSYANYPKIKALNNKFQIPSTAIESRAN